MLGDNLKVNLFSVFITPNKTPLSKFFLCLSFLLFRLFYEWGVSQTTGGEENPQSNWGKKP